VVGFAHFGSFAFWRWVVLLPAREWAGICDLPAVAASLGGGADVVPAFAIQSDYPVGQLAAEHGLSLYGTGSATGGCADYWAARFGYPD
jgi:hypothetical protein